MRLQAVMHCPGYHVSACLKAFLFFLAVTNLSTVAASRCLWQLKQDRQLTERQPSNANTELQRFVPASCEEVYARFNPKARVSGSCSLGATKGFVGPLQTWADVRAMLHARSFKGEIILTHETRSDTAIQWLWRLMRMGYAHSVVVARGEHSCAQLRKVYGEHLGCVWFPHSVSYSSAGGASGGGAVGTGPSLRLAPGEVALFLEEPPFWRLQMAALVARLGGYNLLSLDSDVVLQDDFYWWMRQPDYRGYHLLVQRDVSSGLPDPGVLYVRGASPSGPTAWALGDALLRNIRWREQPQLPASVNSTLTTCWEEAVLTDAIYSALVGRPVFPRCLETRQLDRSWNVREDGRQRFVAANQELIRPVLSRKNYSMDRPGPACHAALVGPEGLWAQEGQLRAPHTGGQWPGPLGGRALGDMGPVAEAFTHMLREAGPPLWPDPEDPAAAAAAAAVPPERLALLSRHLACDWVTCGSQGMFLALQPPQQGPGSGLEAAMPQPEPCVVVGHLVLTPDGSLGKRFQLAANGHLNLDLAAALHGPGGPFFATNAQHHTGLGGAVMARAGHHHAAAVRRGQMIPAPRVIALAPGALSPGPDPASAAAGGSGPGSSPSSPPLVLSSKAHLISVVEALSSLAVATGRTLALPRLSCDYPWMHRAPSGGGGSYHFNGSHHVPWSYLAGEAFAPYGPSLERLSCEWMAWAQHGCLHGPVHVERASHVHTNPHPAARMLLSYEMEYFLTQLPPEERTPRAAGTAAAASGGGNVLAVPPGTTAGPDGVYNVTLAQVTEQLARLAAAGTGAGTAQQQQQPGAVAAVLWVERPMRVVDLVGPMRMAHQQWVTHCCGLSWPQSRNHICFWEF